MERFEKFDSAVRAEKWNWKNDYASPDKASIDELWNDPERFIRWSEGLFVEAIEDLQEQGVDVSRPISNATLLKAFDSVLLTRAIRSGFKVDVDRPFYIIKIESPREFRRRLEEGQFFYDFIGDLVFYPTAKLNRFPYRHTARGHAIQLVYAAENIPGFMTILKTEFSDYTWLAYFDGAFNRNFRSPGFAVDLLRHLFGIRK